MKDTIVKFWEWCTQPPEHRILGSIIIGVFAAIGVFSTTYTVDIIVGAPNLIVFLSLLSSLLISALVGHYFIIKMGI